MRVRKKMAMSKFDPRIQRFSPPRSREWRPGVVQMGHNSWDAEVLSAWDGERWIPFVNEGFVYTSGSQGEISYLRLDAVSLLTIRQSVEPEPALKLGLEQGW